MNDAYYIQEKSTGLYLAVIGEQARLRTYNQIQAKFFRWSVEEIPGVGDYITIKSISNGLFININPSDSSGDTGNKIYSMTLKPTALAINLPIVRPEFGYVNLLTQYNGDQLTLFAVDDSNHFVLWAENPNKNNNETSTFFQFIKEM